MGTISTAIECAAVGILHVQEHRMGWLEHVQTTVWARHEDVRIHSILNIGRKPHLTVFDRKYTQLKKSTLVAADFEDFLTGFTGTKTLLRFNRAFRQYLLN